MTSDEHFEAIQAETEELAKLAIDAHQYNRVQKITAWLDDWQHLQSRFARLCPPEST